MEHFRFFVILIFFCVCLFFFAVPVSIGQDVPVTPAAENTSESGPIESFEIKLSVNEVRLDVVVLDKQGNPITDLTAAEFEVYQDDKLQAVLDSVYIDSRPDPVAQNSPTLKDIRNLPKSSSHALKKDDVRRNIIFLIDDFAMSFENSYHTKTALRTFVEKQMQPGDLVAVIRTGYGNSALNMFYSDKRELLAGINALPATNAIKTVDVSDWLLENGHSRAAAAARATQANFDIRAAVNLLNNLSYSLRVANTMPGRTIINTITPGINVAFNPISLHAVSDMALRSDAVINFLDIDGIDTNDLISPVVDASNRNRSTQYIPIIRRRRLSNPLPDLTGGVVIEDRNFFLSGIGRKTENLMRGYYLISYVPPPDTFGKQGKDDDGYRQVKINVKRSGSEVYTRDGFFGRPESETQDKTSENPLYEAIYSPFQSTEINVDIAAGYVKDAEAGYLVRSWIHIDPEDVKIVETEEGGRIDLDAIIVTSNLNGSIQDSRKIEFTLSKTRVDWVRKHGLRFSMLLPVEKPGSYYIRISVQDKETGGIGSAYQFLEIPEIGKKELALSNLFMITSEDDLGWMRSDAAKAISEGVFFPMFQAEEVRSPARRTYKPGDMFYTLAILYNADEKAIARSEIETQTVLFKDGKEIHQGNATTVAPDNVDVSDNSVPILRSFTLSSDMPPGDYTLLLTVTDKKNSKKKTGIAVQALNFTVVEK